MYVLDLHTAPWSHHRRYPGRGLEYRGRVGGAVVRALKERLDAGALDRPQLVAVVWVGGYRSPNREVLERALEPVVTALRRSASAPMVVSFAWRRGAERTIEVVLNPKE